MTDDDSDNDKKRQSRLSGATASGPRATRGPGSILSAAGRSDENDPAARHRLARSRREAAPSPLLAALAAMEGFRAEPEPAAEPKTSRWSLRNLLSPKLKYEKPEPEAAPKQKQQPAEPTAAAVSPKTSPEPERPEEPADDARSDESPVETVDAWRDDTQWRPLIDPLHVIGGVGSSKALIVATTLIGTIIGLALAISTPKKYEAVAELLVDPRDLKFSDRELTQTGLPSDATLALVENQVRVITSGTVLNKVVDELKLENDPEFNGQRQGGIGNILSSLRALLSGGSGGGGDLRRALAVGNLGESLHVERAGETFIVTVGATTEDPEKSALIVNTVNEVFLETTGALQSDTAGRAADELNARLEELRDGLEEAERKSERFRAENDLIDAQGRLISDDELVKLNDQLSIARARTIELNARAASARSVKVDSVIGGALPEELSSSVMSELRSQYAAIKQEADRLSVRLGPRHPQHLSMQAQLQGAREQIGNELRRIVATVQTELKRAVQQEQDLAARLAQLKVHSTDVNSDLVTLRELEREAAAKRAIYENYLVRAKEAGEQRDINTANISVISQAYPPLEPTGPSRATITLGGTMMGLLAGLAIGIARGIFTSVRDKGRGRRRSRLAAPMAAEHMEAIDEPADRLADVEPGGKDMAAKAPDDATSNPLARLIERIRRPARSDSTRNAGDMPASAATADANSNPDPETEIPGREARANQEPPQMYPYPPQPPVYPQQQSVYPEQAIHAGQPAYPQAPPYAQPAPYPPSYQPAFAQPPHYPPAFAPQPLAYPYPPAMPPQPAFHGWQPQPPAMSPYGYPQPVVYPPYPPAAAQPAQYPQEVRPANPPAPEGRAAASPREMTPIEEVRESLREFREAIRDLAEDRSRRRYS
jgi:succinoglycan biosynthesis transport protein ExoP